MSFTTAYEAFLESERQGCSSERRRRLRGGLGFAEKAFIKLVWWPAFGDFTYLHPEHEVTDYGGGSRFVNFAYIRGGVRVAIEIDGYTSHVKNLDRDGFSYRLRRQNLLIIDGWDILRFSHDDVQSQPRRCQQALQQYMGARFAFDASGGDLGPMEREIVRLVRAQPRPSRPSDIAQHLGRTRQTIYRHLRRLVDCGFLTAVSGGDRLRAYEATDRARNAPF